jgi:hypothetical protein
MRLCQKRAPCSELSREKGQVMSRHDRDAEIAAFIRTKGVTRCPTACVVPTQGSPDLADQAALQQYANARDQLLRTKIATRWKLSSLCGFGVEPRHRSYIVLPSSATEIGHRKRDPGASGNHPAMQNIASRGERARPRRDSDDALLEFREGSRGRNRLAARRPFDEPLRSMVEVRITASSASYERSDASK